jgi:CelD/BcsL family acetyltransferase involved in cellulose biosynthesis
MLSCEVITTARELASYAGDWAALLQRSATNEPTLSPLWLLPWWRVFGPRGGRQLRVVLLRHRGRLVGLAPLLVRRHWYRPGIPVRRLELLGSGEPEQDEICSDYIGIIAEQGYEEVVAETLARGLSSTMLGGWDELVLPSLNGESALSTMLYNALSNVGPVSSTVQSAAPYTRLPGSWEEYLKTLAARHRQKLRRSLRTFERWANGNAKVVCATSEVELARGFNILRDLHQARWRAADRPGVFASAPFCAFHRAVMRSLLARNALKLMWITVDGQPVAATYQIVWNGKAYVYQGGNRVDLGNGIHPGIVIRCYSIQHAISAGLREFDAWGGAYPYKMRFAHGVRPLHRLHLARPSAVIRLHRLVKRAECFARATRALARRRLAAVAWPALGHSHQQQRVAADAASNAS